jgi:hypothetical protein
VSVNNRKNAIEFFLRVGPDHSREVELYTWQGAKELCNQGGIREFEDHQLAVAHARRSNSAQCIDLVQLFATVRFEFQ